MRDQTMTSTEAFHDFMSFGFRASDDAAEPGHLDVVAAFLFGALSRGDKDPFHLDRNKPLHCMNVMRAQAARFPHAPVGRKGFELSPVGRAYEAMATLYAMRIKVRQGGTIVFDKNEFHRLRRVARSQLSLASANFAMFKDELGPPPRILDALDVQPQ